MSFNPQRLASVRSYFFRRHLAGIYPCALERYTLNDFRPYWREAQCQAREQLRQATNRYDPLTRTWDANPK